MSNSVYHTMEIHCDQPEILKLVKQILFVNNKEKKLKFSFEKLLPKPRNIDWTDDEELNWCFAVWGTVDFLSTTNLKITEKCISFQYETRWATNSVWLELFCRFINSLLFENSTSTFFELRLSYFDEGDYITRSTVWHPGEELHFDEFPFNINDVKKLIPDPVFVPSSKADFVNLESTD